MADFPAIPLWTDAYLADTASLTNEEHGVYLKLLMFAWRAPTCALPDDDRRLALMVGVTPKKWASLRPIIATFWTVQNGTWTQKRLTAERDFVTRQSEKAKAAAEARWGRKPLKDKDSDDATALTGHMPDVCPSDTPTPTPIKKEREERGKPLSRPSDNSDECLDHFNAVAQRVGWPKVQRLTPARKAALSHRIADCGGEDAWRDAINRAALSPLLTGQTGRGWRADFDWLCKASNFTKLMEGNYDPRPETDQPSRSGPQRGSGMVEAFAAVAAARSGRS